MLCTLLFPFTHMEDNSRDFRKEILSFRLYDETYKIRLEYTSYSCNGTLALQMMNLVDDGQEEPFGIATVNLPDSGRLALNEQYVDTNNMPGIAEWLTCHGIATPTGAFGHSGYCTYPVFEFNLPKEVESELISAREDVISKAVIELVENSGLSPDERTRKGDRYHIAEGTDIVIYHGGTDKNLGKNPDVFLLASSSKHKDRDMWRLRNLPHDVRKALADDIRTAVRRGQSSHMKIH